MNIRIWLLLSPLVLLALLAGEAFGYFSDVLRANAAVASGSVAVQAALSCEAEGERPLLIYGAVLPVELTLHNTGASDISVEIEASVAFLDDIGEGGKFYLFSAALPDSEILAQAEAGRFDGALIGTQVSDAAEVWTAEGSRNGIRERVEQGTLASGATAVYAYKLLFYPGGELHALNVRDAEWRFTAVCDVQGRDTLWKTDVSEPLPVTAVTDVTPPVLTKTGLPETFFITQTDGIDLAAYATAFDDFDGNITDQIRFECSPAFDTQRAGTYRVTYTVSDRAGNAAEPVTVDIVIWDFVKIESGNYHTLALTSHGRVYAWGYNDVGQLGDGTTTQSTTPRRIDTLTGIIDIAAGTSSSYALQSDGTLLAWGYNVYGQLGNGTTGSRNVPTAVAMPDGVVFQSVSANYLSAGAIAQNGDVYTWGYGNYGAAGTGDGTDNRVPTKINVTDAVQLTMGYYNGAAVTGEGVLITWGDNYHGQLGTGRPMVVSTNAPAPVTYFTDNNIKISSVSAGWYHMLAASDTGEVFSWGYGLDGRLGLGTGGDRNTPQKVALQSVVEVHAAYYHSGVRTELGEVYFFGQNAYGKHGTGNTTTHTTPVIVPGIGNATSLTLALDSSFALLGGQITFGMGYGGTGVLGNGASASHNYPVPWAFTPPEPY